MARQVHPARTIGVRYDDFPVPVTLMPDETEFDARVLVHRRVAVDHVDHCDCPCVPHRFTRAQVADLTADALNNMMDADLN